MSRKILVSNCEECPCQYDGYCNIGNGVNCDIAIYGLPANGVVGDCMKGGIPEQCPLRKQKVVIRPARNAVVNIGQCQGANYDKANTR